MLVKKGSTTGGDFQRTPACTGSTQTGCVVAYSTYNRTPPDNTRFGKYTPPAGQPDDKEVLCTNPASLTGGSAPVTTELPSERFPPGLIAASLMQFFGTGGQPTAPTPWLQPKERYSARCVREANTNTLRLASVGDSRQPNASPDETWGLHIGDANLAMGNLVELARSQSRALPGCADAHGARSVPDKGRRGQGHAPGQGAHRRQPQRPPARADRPSRDRPRRRRPLLRHQGRQPAAVLPEPPQRCDDPPPTGRPHAAGPGHQQALQRSRREAGHARRRPCCGASGAARR